MNRARIRHRLAPQIAAALILSALGSCAKPDSDCCEEQAITMSEVPASVADAISRESAGGRVLEIERERREGRAVYSAEIERDGKTWDIVIAEDGTVLSRETD